MSRALSPIILVVAIVLFNLLTAAANAGKRKKENDREAPVREPPAARRQSVSAQKREAAQRGEQWRAAKAQQDDAHQVHSIHMDSCENRLESLRVLYDAGILDREEYVQRVSRVKAQHAHGVKR